MHVLVTVASRHGSSTELARAIAEQLIGDSVSVDVRSPEDVVDVGGYDAVVLGSAVYAGRWLASAKELVERCGEGLRARPVWLFSSGPVGDPPKPAEDPADAAAIVAATGAREHRVFAGKLDKQALNLAERAIVAMVRAPEGDYRDWSAVRMWASAIAEVLRAEQSRA